MALFVGVNSTTNDRETVELCERILPVAEVRNLVFEYCPTRGAGLFSPRVWNLGFLGDQRIQPFDQMLPAQQLGAMAVADVAARTVRVVDAIHNRERVLHIPAAPADEGVWGLVNRVTTEEEAFWNFMERSKPAVFGPKENLSSVGTYSCLQQDSICPHQGRMSYAQVVSHAPQSAADKQMWLESMGHVCCLQASDTPMRGVEVFPPSLAMYSQLTKLEVTCTPKAVSSLLDLIPKFPRLQVLQITTNPTRNLIPQRLQALKDQNPNLVIIWNDNEVQPSQQTPPPKQADGCVIL